MPLVHGANKISQWLPSFEGVMPFRQNNPQHPHINYRNMAIRGLFELRRMVDELDKRLPEIACPVALLQGDNDDVVDPKSLDLIHAKLGTAEKWLHRIPSKRHGILNESIGNSQELVIAFLASMLAERKPAR